jgi:hypothetical protein
MFNRPALLAPWLLAAGIVACGSSSDSSASGGPQGKTAGSGGACAACDGVDDPLPLDNDLKGGTRTGTGGSAGTAGTFGGAGGAGGNPQPSVPAACAGLTQVDRPITTATSDANGWASAAWAREQLEQLTSPLPLGIRTQDFLNYYFVDISGKSNNIGSGANAAAEPMVTIQMAPSTNVPKLYNLMVALQAPPATSTAPRWVSVVVDTRPAMAGASLERAQAVLFALASHLGKGDHVAVVTTEPDSAVEYYDIAEPGAPALKMKAQSLTVGSEAMLADALGKAYGAALSSGAPPSADRRVLLISNGADDPESLPADTIKNAADSGFLMASIATGPALSHGDRFMRAAAKLGRGHYLYVDSTAEAQRLFDEQASELFGIAFQDVQLDVTFPWYFNLVPSSTEATTTTDAAEPQDLAVGGHSTFLFKLEICDATMLAYGGSVQVTVRWKSGQTLPISFPLTSAPQASAQAQLAKALAVYTYAEALKTLDARRLEEAQTLVASALEQNPNDAHLVQIGDLLAKHPALTQPAAP